MITPSLRAVALYATIMTELLSHRLMKHNSASSAGHDECLVVSCGSCPPSLQTIVSIEFLVSLSVGCALCFLFFLKRWNFLKTIFLLGWLSKLY